MIKKIQFLFQIEFKYIVINLLVSSFGFIRAFFMMRELSLVELGLISILQTLIMLMSFSQLGLINGAYRMYCEKVFTNKNAINDTVHSYVFIICLIFIPVLIFLNIFNFINIDYNLIFFGLIVGLLSIFNNWINNIFIAIQQLENLNHLNFWSAIISLLFALMIPFYGYYFAVISIISSPIFYFFYAYYKYPELRPKSFNFDLIILNKILSYGFIPFLAGIFGLLNIQIEIWSISFFLDLENLGKFYLPILITSLFFLVPSSINSLYFPTAVKYFTSGEKILFFIFIKRYYLIIIIYSLIVSLLIIFLFKPIVLLLFPVHVDSIIYVYIIMPGLIFKLLAEPIWLVFNSAVTLRPIFWANIISLILTFFGVVYLYYFEIFNLFNISILKSFIGFQLFVFAIFSYIYINKHIDNLLVIRKKK